MWLSVVIISLYILLTNNFLQNYRWGELKITDKYIDIESINVPENYAVKLYGFPTAMIGALIVQDKNIPLLGYGHRNLVQMQGTDFVERGKFLQERNKLENLYKDKSIAIKRIFYLPKHTVSPLDKTGMYCRPLYFNVLKGDFEVCVPQKLKNKILPDEDKYGEKK